MVGKPASASQDHSNWQRPIIFEGNQLPGASISLDRFASTEFLPGIAEETALWFWRFTICVGRLRSAPSEEICSHVDRVIDLSLQRDDKLRTFAADHVDKCFDRSVLDDWLASLGTIRRIAGGCDDCSWIAPLRPGDKNYGKSYGEVAKNISKGLAAMAKNLRPGGRQP